MYIFSNPMMTRGTTPPCHRHHVDTMWAPQACDWTWLDINETRVMTCIKATSRHGSDNEMRRKIHEYEMSRHTKDTISRHFELFQGHGCGYCWFVSKTFSTHQILQTIDPQGLIYAFVYVFVCSQERAQKSTHSSLEVSIPALNGPQASPPLWLHPNGACMQPTFYALPGFFTSVWW